MRRVPSRAQRAHATGLAKRHLTGRKRSEAIAWIHESTRTAVDLSAFINRLNAASDPQPVTIRATEAPNGEQTPS